MVLFVFFNVPMESARAKGIGPIGQQNISFNVSLLGHDSYPPENVFLCYQLYNFILNLQFHRFLQRAEGRQF